MFEDQKMNNQVKTVFIEQSKCTFKPKINEHSRKLAQSASRERLPHSKCKQDGFS